MAVYLVGGAVRDRLLGRPGGDRDWVVTGSTPEAMAAAGYRQVGREFPVFLHPTTHEEYALARTERKVGSGHTGFICAFGPDVTLEMDLARRDLTINAIAEDGEGRLFDPFGGVADLEARWLRHVSPAFREDPLRVLRVARFAAQLAPWQFAVHPVTATLLADMVASGELASLTPERVLAELERALGAADPRPFFAVLDGCAALEALFPGFGAFDAAIAAVLADPRLDDPVRRFGGLCGALGRSRSVALLARLPLPRRHAELARLALGQAEAVAGYAGADIDARLALLERCDALRRPERFADLLQVVGALGDVRGRSTAQALGQVRRDCAAVAGIDARVVVADPALGSHPAERLRAARRGALAVSAGDPVPDG